jgi:flagellar biosynthesis protein FlhG
VAGLALAPRRTPIARRDREGRATTIAVTSGKGGVGKTTLTANLATVFARLGHRTLLIDADLGLAGLDLALGLSPRFDLGDVLDGRARVEDALLTGPFGVTLLPAAPGRAELAALGPTARAMLLALVEEVARRFDVVLIDTGGGIGATVLDFAAMADEVVLVVTPDPLALRDAYAMAKVLERRSGRVSVDVLTNHLTAGTDELAVHRKLESLAGRFLGLELRHAGAIRHDVAIAEACAHGVPLVLSEPSSSVARVLTSLARELVARRVEHEPPNELPLAPTLSLVPQPRGARP